MGLWGSFNNFERSHWLEWPVKPTPESNEPLSRAPRAIGGGHFTSSCRSRVPAPLVQLFDALIAASCSRMASGADVLLLLSCSGLVPPSNRPTVLLSDACRPRYDLYPTVRLAAPADVVAALWRPKAASLARSQTCSFRGGGGGWGGTTGASPGRAYPCAHWQWGTHWAETGWEAHVACAVWCKG